MADNAEPRAIAPRMEANCLYGEWQQPINRWMNLEDSIHNDRVARGIGMRGGTIPGMVHMHAGPLRMDVPYRKTGQIACVAATPKTEVAWVDSQLWNQAGTKVAEMRHMTRWMKTSSPLWASG